MIGRDTDTDTRGRTDGNQQGKGSRIYPTYVL